MERIIKALKQPKFRWLPKHLNHIAENIVFKKRNISFLAINWLFRSKGAKIYAFSEGKFKNSYKISGIVPLQNNDALRTKEDLMHVIFQIDKHLNITVITAYNSTEK